MSCPVSKHFSTRDLQSLHLSPDKNSKYMEFTPALDGDEHTPSLVFDGKLALQILRSPSFTVVSVADGYRKVSEKTGIDLSAMIDMMDVMPLFLNGEKHKETRLKMAGFLAKNRTGQQKALETAMNDAFAMHLKAGGTMDLVYDLSLPMYHFLTAALVGVDWKKTYIKDEYPRTLDPMLSLNRRKELNESMIEALANHENDEVPPEYAMALVSLGHDTFVGSVALGLWHVLDRNPNTPLNEIVWPKSFPTTSAPFTERIATEDCKFDGIKIPAGGRVRLVLEASTEYGALEQKDIVFGKGRHVCVGRTISEFGWQLLVDRLSQSNLRVQTKPLKYRSPDSCFRFPDSSEVTFYD